MAPATLDEVLQQFYLEVRKQDGSEYEPDSLNVMQAALERYLLTKKYSYSLINGREFSSSRAVLDAKAKQLRMNGYGKRKNRTEPYNSSDEEKFWPSGPLGDHIGAALTNADFKNLSEHFGFRGRQDHYDAYVEDFEVAFVQVSAVLQSSKRRKPEVALVFCVWPLCGHYHPVILITFFFIEDFRYETFPITLLVF